MFKILFFLVLTVVVVKSLKKPGYALAFLLNTWAVEQWFQSKDAFFIYNGSLINICSGVVVLIALTSKFLSSGSIRMISKEHFLVLGLYLYAFISIFWTPVPEIAYSNLNDNIPYFAIYLVFAPLLISTQKDLEETLQALLFIGIPLVILLLFFTTWGYRNVVMPIDLKDVKINPLVLASTCAYTIIVAMFFNVQGRYKKVWDIAKWPIMIMALMVIARTESRGQILAVILICLFFRLFNFRNMNPKRAVITLLSGAVVLLTGYFAIEIYSTDARWDSERLGSDYSGRYSGAFTLLAHWISSAVTILMGLGVSASYSKEIAGFYVHIVPIEILGEYGLIGFGLFLWLISTVVIRFKKLFVYARKYPLERSLLICFFSLFFFEFILCFKQGSLLGTMNLMLLIILQYKVIRIIRLSLKKSQKLSTLVSS